MVWATPTKSAVVAIGVVVCAALLAATHSYERVAVALVLVAVGYLLAMGNSLLLYLELAKTVHRYVQQRSATLREPPPLPLLSQAPSAERGDATAIGASTEALPKVLDDLVHYVVRDFVRPWYTSAVSGDPTFPLAAEAILRDAAQRLRARARRVDLAMIFTHSVSHTLIVQLREFHRACASDVTRDAYFSDPARGGSYLHFGCQSRDNEATYLRNVAEVLIAHLLPEHEARSDTLRLLLREVLVCQCLAPLVESITDPDVINNIILSLLINDSTAGTAQEDQPSPCVPSHPSPPPPLPPPPSPVRLLTIRLYKGKNFSALPSHVGASYPFCVLFYGDTELRSANVARDTLWWDEVFTVDLDGMEREDDTVRIVVYEWNPFVNAVVLGETTVRLSGDADGTELLLADGEPHKQWFGVFAAHQHDAVGELLLEVQCPPLHFRAPLLQRDTTVVADASPFQSQSPSRRDTMTLLDQTTPTPTPQPYHMRSTPATPDTLVVSSRTFSVARHAKTAEAEKEEEEEGSEEEVGVAGVGAIESQGGDAARKGSSLSRNPLSRWRRTRSERLKVRQQLKSEQQQQQQHQYHVQLLARAKRRSKMTLDSVLGNINALSYFMEFMCREKATALLQLWINVNQFRAFAQEHLASEPDQVRQEAFNIFTLHFSSGAPLQVKLDESTVRAVEMRLRDRSRSSSFGSAASSSASSGGGGRAASVDELGADCFDRAQNTVLRRMRERYFPRFQRSDLYRNLLYDLDHDVMPSSDASSAEDEKGRPGRKRSVREAEEEEESGEGSRSMELTLACEGDSVSVHDGTEGEEEGSELSSKDDDEEEKAMGVDVTTDDQSSVVSGASSVARERDAEERAQVQASYDPIGAAVVLLREQQAVLDTLMERAETHEQAQRLMGQREELETELVQLLAMVEERHAHKQLQQQVNALQDNHHIVSASIVSSEHDDGGGVHVRANRILYFIQVVRASTVTSSSSSSSSPVSPTTTGFVVARRLADFRQAHLSLAEKFKKVRLLPFPSPKEELRNPKECERTLNDWLNRLLSDEILRESEEVHLLLKIESDGMLSDPSPGRDGEEGKMAMRKLVRRATEKLQKIRRVARNNSGTAKEKTSSYGQQQQMPYGGVQEAPEFIAEDNGVVSGLLERERTEQRAKRLVEENKKRKKKEHEKKMEEQEGGRESGEGFDRENAQILLDALFALFEEAFELRSRNHWLRRKALNLTRQILEQWYGDEINRRILEECYALTNEQAMLSYMSRLSSYLFPNGTVFEGRRGVMTGDEREGNRGAGADDARATARLLVLHRVPETAQRMVGRFNSIHGVSRLFDMLQDRRLNKHLLYSALDALLVALFR